MKGNPKPYLITGAALTVFIVIATILYAVTINSVQRWICVKGVEILSKELGTRVSLDSVDVSMVRREVTLYGFEVEDRRRLKMLSVDTLSVRVGLIELLRSKVNLRNVRLYGVEARFYKERRDTAANYQFVIDALSSGKRANGNKSKAKDHLSLDVNLQHAVLDGMRFRWDVLSEPVKVGDTLDANHVYIDGVSLTVENVEKKGKDVSVTLRNLKCRESKSGIRIAVDGITYHTMQQRNVAVSIGNAQCTYRDMEMNVRHVTISQRQRTFSMMKPIMMRLDTMTYRRDNGKPHKRTGKPHRGYFDPGHVEMLINADVMVHYLASDSAKIDVTRFSAYDKFSGLDVRNMVALLEKHHDTLVLSNMSIALQRTKISIGRMEAGIGNNGENKGGGLRLRPFPLTARVHLCDIAKPFAPVLSDFTTPLDLNVIISGTPERLLFKDIQIFTPDKRLRLTARGEMLDVAKRYDLRLRFNNIRLDARRGIKEIIVSHFAKKVRLKMLKQMQKIGDIRYHGNMGVYFRREDFAGTLFTKYGSADFAFTIDGKTKQMTGNISTDSLALGSIMNVKGLDRLKADATFCFSVTSKRRVDANRQGRLPIGWMTAHVDSVRFRKMIFTDISAFLQSNGATATGDMYVPGKLFDISLKVWYTQTDSVQEMKFKPRILKSKKTNSPFTFVKKWKNYMKEARKRKQS